MELTVSIQQAEEPIAIMRIKGDINASNFLEVVNKAQEIYNKPSRNLIIDLSEVTSVSTTGLVALHKIALVYSGASHEIDADAPTKERRPDFTHHSNARKFVKLLNPQPDVEKALEKAGMKLFFKIYKDLENAIESF
jgi:anti-anti-sigma regulatory factor